MSLTPGMRNLASTVREPGAPARKLPLSGADRARVDAAYEALSQSSLEVGQIYDLFEDWQSRRTLLSKRLLTSASVIVAAVVWVGMDLSNFSFLGVEVGNGSLGRFVFFLAGFIVLSGLYFESSRRIDRSVQRAQIYRIADELNELEPHVVQLSEIADRYDLESEEQLLDDSRGGIIPEYNDVNAYNAVEFYRRYLQRAGVGQSVLEMIEVIGIYAVTIYALVGLLRTWIA